MQDMQSPLLARTIIREQYLVKSLIGTSLSGDYYKCASVPSQGEKIHACFRYHSYLKHALLVT